MLSLFVLKVLWRLTNFVGGKLDLSVVEGGTCLFAYAAFPSYSLWPWWWNQQISSATPIMQSSAMRCSHLKFGSTTLILFLSYKRVWRQAAAPSSANHLERVSPWNIKCILLSCCLNTLWIYDVVWHLWWMSKCVWSLGRMIVTGENWSAWRQHCPTTTLSTTNPTWSVLR